MTEVDKAAAPDAVWCVTRVAQCKGFGTLITFDAVHPQTALPGSFVTLRPAGTSLRAQGYSLVSVPGDEYVVAAYGEDRTWPQAFSDAMTVGGSFEAGPIQSRSAVLSQPGSHPHLVYACGRNHLALVPLVGAIRAHAQPDVHATTVVWCIHTEEEVAGFVDALKETGPPQWKKQGGSPPSVVVVRCGSGADGSAVEQLVAALTADGASVREVAAGDDGLSVLPKLLRETAAKGGEGSNPPAVEVFGDVALHRDLRRSLPASFSFYAQHSFGCRPSSGADKWLSAKPWPLSYIMPWRCLLPWRSESRPVALPEWLFLPTDPLPLALFRMAFGFLCAFYAFKALAVGRVTRDHVVSEMRFKYDNLEFLGPDMPIEYVYWWYTVMGISAVGLCIGWPYRLSCLVFTITFGWHFFAEATHYNNHYWLMTLLGVHFLLAGADDSFSLKPWRMYQRRKRRLAREAAAAAAKKDAAEPPQAPIADATPTEAEGVRRRNVSKDTPRPPVPIGLTKGPAPPPGDLDVEPSVRPIPFLYHFMFRNFVLFVFFYGAIAKMNSDWISGHTLRAGLLDNPPWVVVELSVFFLGWGGLVFDGCGPLYILHAYTRPFGMLIYSFFNCMNMVMWSIGVFPYMMMGAMPLLSETWTARHVVRVMAANAVTVGQAEFKPAEGARCVCLRRFLHRFRSVLGFFGRKVLENLPPFLDGPRQLHDNLAWRTRPGGSIKPQAPAVMNAWRRGRTRAIIVAVVLLYTVAHCVVPLRHYYYHWGTGQSVSWTEHGRKFSWHMMSRYKDCAGTLLLHHHNNDLLQFHISVGNGTYDGPLVLNDHQIKKLPTVASYIRQYAWAVRKYYERGLLLLNGYDGVELTDHVHEIKNMSRALKIYANFTCRLNGAPDQPFISPDFDISRAPPPKDWETEPYVIPQKVFGTVGYPDVGRGWLPY